MASPLKTSTVKIFDTIVPFLVVLIFAAVFGSFFYYIIQPELQKYLQGGPANYASVKELLDSRTVYRNDLNGLAEFASAAEQNGQDPIALVLPSNEDVPTLYALFEKLAKDAGVGLQVIDISQKTEDAKSAKSQIRAALIQLRYVNVDYPTLKRLIEVLESNIRLTRITSLSYDPAGQTASILVSVYYFKTSQ